MNRYVLLLSALALVAAPAGSPLLGQVRINEVMAANRLAFADLERDFPDWVEIVNAGPKTIDLTGASLTDDPLVPRRWVFPKFTLRPGEHVVVWCSGKNRDIDGQLHTNFELSRQGEALALLDAGGEVIDELVYPIQTEDRSWGRFPNAGTTLRYMLRPTPGRPNEGPASETPLAARPAISPTAGKQSEAVEVSIDSRLPFPEIVVRMATDGSPPTADSALYAGPFTADETIIVRAAAFLEEERVSQVATRTYFFDANAYDLPILAVSMPWSDFVAVHLSNFNRGRQWEREAYVEILDADGRLAAESALGLRLHGGAGRSGPINHKKSYRMYFRADYGDPKLQFPLFADSTVTRFDQIVLRSNVADAFRGVGNGSLIRDQIVRDLHRDMGALSARGTWYNLFVDTQYRGVYNVTERLDKSFLSSNVEGTIDEEWDVIKTNSEVHDGNADAWLELMTFFENARLEDPAVFEQAGRLLDIEQFTRYMLLEIWSQNQDWPANNWYGARRRADGELWRFFVWDAEAGLGLAPEGWETDSFTHVLNSRNTELQRLFEGLLENLGYQEYLLAELDRLLENELSPENVIAHLDHHADTVRDDMPEEAAAVQVDPGEWETAVENIRAFAVNRGTTLRRFVFSSPRILLTRAISAAPNRVTMREPTRVIINGKRFTSQTRVFFNELESPEVTLLTEERLEVLVPYDLDVMGLPDVRVEQDGLSLVTRGILTVTFPRPVIASISPASGSEEGGQEVLISGVEFLEGVRVEFGGVPSPHVERFFDTPVLLKAITPPGQGTVDVRVINTRPGELPALETRSFTYLPTSPPPVFRRGDADGDGSVAIGDAVFILDVLFRSLQGPRCDDALDVDDSGRINLTDAIALLDFLFRGPAPAPRPPFEACGTDPTEDALRCAPAPTSCN